MGQMFYMASSFNQDISTKQVQDKNGKYYTAWDVSSVTDMSYMFGHAKSFNQPIGNWDTSIVTNMAEMFRYATDFNHNISNWDVDNVTNHDKIFESSYISGGYKPHKFGGPLNPYDPIQSTYRTPIQLQG